MQTVTDHCRLLQTIADKLFQTVTDLNRQLYTVTYCSIILLIILDRYRLVPAVSEYCTLVQIVADCCRIMQTVADFFKLF